MRQIINSIHSIEDSKRKDGRISIKVLRSTQGELNIEDQGDSPRAIVGFSISDNGKGFNQDNYLSFTTADSRWKANRGGRGVGRFLWLKAFEVAKVESVFQNQGKWERRQFNFKLSEEGIEKHTLGSIEAGPNETTVSLLGFKPTYQSYAPKQLPTIASRIVEHCLEYFVLGLAPTILIRDDDSDDVIDLQSVYEDLVAISEKVKLPIGKYSFSMIHFMLHAHGGLSHKVCYCANYRVVQGDNLTSTKVPYLITPITSSEEQGDFIYNGYISGKYLDSHVNQERTGFNNLVEDGGLEFEGEMPWPIIEEAANKCCKRVSLPPTYKKFEKRRASD